MSGDQPGTHDQTEKQQLKSKRQLRRSEGHYAGRDKSSEVDKPLLDKPGKQSDSSGRDKSSEVDKELIFSNFDHIRKGGNEDKLKAALEARDQYTNFRWFARTYDKMENIKSKTYLDIGEDGKLTITRQPLYRLRESALDKGGNSSEAVEMFLDRVIDGVLSKFPDGSFAHDYVGPALTFLKIGEILDQSKTEKENQRLLSDKSDDAMQKRDSIHTKLIAESMIDENLKSTDPGRAYDAQRGLYNNYYKFQHVLNNYSSFLLEDQLLQRRQEGMPPRSSRPTMSSY